jgi:uncharacterized protein (DUF1330 family)
MSAYVISEVTIKDEHAASVYRALAASSIAKHHGEYIVRGADPVIAEGGLPGGAKVVIVRFESMKALKTWYQSPEYAEALKIKPTALARNLFFAEGL